MAYTPTTWSDGDVITADKLNKLEQGVKNEQVGPAGPAGPADQQDQQGQKAIRVRRDLLEQVTLFQQQTRQRLVA